MIRDRRGFTLVEVLIVITILGILARIAQPRYQDVRRRAVAGKVIGNFRALTLAAHGYSADFNQWPATSGAGVVPPVLVPYLVTGFPYKTADYSYTWTSSTITVNGVKQKVGIQSASMPDAQVCAKAASLLGGAKNPDLSFTCAGTTGKISLIISN